MPVRVHTRHWLGSSVRAYRGKRVCCLRFCVCRRLEGSLVEHSPYYSVSRHIRLIPPTWKIRCTRRIFQPDPRRLQRALHGDVSSLPTIAFGAGGRMPYVQPSEGMGTSPTQQSRVGHYHRAEVAMIVLWPELAKPRTHWLGARNSFPYVSMSTSTITEGNNK